MNINQKYSICFSTNDELDNFDFQQIRAWLDKHVGELDKKWTLDWGNYSSITIQFLNQSDYIKFMLTWK